MNISDETVQKVQKFVENRQEAERESKEETFSATALHVYTRRLDATLQGLQEQVKRQQDELNKVSYKISNVISSSTDIEPSSGSSTFLTCQKQAPMPGPVSPKPDGPRKHTTRFSNPTMSSQQQTQCCHHF
jgi:seryl-tRNA synthetase